MGGFGQVTATNDANFAAVGLHRTMDCHRSVPPQPLDIAVCGFKDFTPSSSHPASRRHN